MIVTATLITYDLCKPGQDYKQLISKIETFPRCCKITESCYIVNTPFSTAVVRDALLPYLDKNDRLFVVMLKNDAAWKNVIVDNEFLKTSMLA